MDTTLQQILRTLFQAEAENQVLRSQVETLSAKLAELEKAKDANPAN